MPKQKTHKGIAKRVKITGRGKVKRRSAGKGHLLSGKKAKRKRQLRKAVTSTNAEAKKLARQIQS